MKNIVLKVTLSIAAIAAAAGCARIKPDEIGVRTKNFAGEGIIPQDYKPGYHRFLWPLDSWHRLPSTVQHIRFAKDSQETWAPQGEPLLITSADGDRVTMEAEVFFRIAEGQANRVLQESGPGERYKEVVRDLAMDEARVHFGALGTEAFYAPESREKTREAAVARLRERLLPRGIELVDLLVVSVEFDANYENLIKQKKLADQRVELEKSKGRAAEEKGKVSKIAAETAVRVQKVDREAEAEMTRRTTELNLQLGTMKAEADKFAGALRADADLYKSQQEAEGTKLLKGAEAEGSQRLNQALVGEGGRNLVALEAVKKLTVADVTFPSVGYDWFNPYEMATRLGAIADPSAAGQKTPPSVKK